MKQLMGLVLVLFCSRSLRAENPTILSVDGKKSEVTFLAVGSPGFMKIRGEKAVLEGRMQLQGGRLQGQFEVALDTFVTGVDLRDRHMKEKHFETNRFPKASFIVDDMPLPPQDKEVEFTGKLTLKSIQKPIRGVWISEKSDDKILQGEARFAVKLSEFPELGVPKYLGITVAEDVRITVKLVANRHE